MSNEKYIMQLEECILTKTPVLVYGPPGIGKTSSVYKIAEKYNYNVIEYNTSDQRKKDLLDKILKEVKMHSFRNKLYLFDEADGIKNWSIIKKIIKNPRYSIVFTANDNIPLNNIKKIRFYPPRKSEIIKIIREECGENISLNGITNDIRNSLINVKYGSQPYEIINEKEEIRKLFYGEKIKHWDRMLYYWIEENINYGYTGKDLFDMIIHLSNIAMYDKPQYLRFKKSNKYVSYLKFPKVLKRKNR